MNQQLNTLTYQQSDTLNISIQVHTNDSQIKFMKHPLKPVPTNHQ